MLEAVDNAMVITPIKSNCSGRVNMRKSQLIIMLVATFCGTSLRLEQVQANPIAAPGCENIPSCVVTGTVVIGGVIYYVIKNTVTGHVSRVTAKQKHNPTGAVYHQVGDVIELQGFVSTLRQCQAKALAYGEKNGGLWGVEELKPIGISSPEADTRGGAQYICKIKRIA